MKRAYRTIGITIPRDSFFAHGKRARDAGVTGGTMHGLLRYLRRCVGFFANRPNRKNPDFLPMRVFLDDERTTPDGWTRAYWPDEVIQLLETGAVTELSLDHDLGDDARGTGYDVILWIEEAVALRGFYPPKIAVHSANSSAREKMLAGIQAIERLIASD